ncbi:unnamed protein product, partial [Prorocentrum cordatum]
RAYVFSRCSRLSAWPRRAECTRLGDARPWAYGAPCRVLPARQEPLTGEEQTTQPRAEEEEEEDPKIRGKWSRPPGAHAASKNQAAERSTRAHSRLQGGGMEKGKAMEAEDKEETGVGIMAVGGDRFEWRKGDQIETWKHDLERPGLTTSLARNTMYDPNAKYNCAGKNDNLTCGQDRTVNSRPLK